MLKKKNQTLNSAIQFDISDQVVLDRLLGRLLHPGSGRTYHKIFRPPKVPMKDDVTGEPLISRDDDKKETIIKRLKIYHEQTTPLFSHYSNKGILVKINANKTAEECFEQIKTAIFK